MPEPVTSAAAMAAGGSALNTLSQGITSAFNLHESRQSRRFARNMSNTEMQRRVKDLRAAGLNPLMAVGGHGLGGAGAPSTSAAHLEAPRVDSMATMQAAQVAAGIQETKARTAKELADTGKIKSETQFLNESMEDRLSAVWVSLQHELKRKDLTTAEENHIVTRIVEIEKQFELMELQRQHSALDLDRMRAESSLYKTLGGFGAAGRMGMLRIPGAALFRARKAGAMKGGFKGRRVGTKMIQGRKGLKMRDIYE